MTEENGTPVSRSVVKRVEDKVDKLDDDLRSLSEALMGKTGLTIGVVEELRRGNKRLGEQWLAFQAHFPEAINAAIVTANDRRARKLVTGVRSWWITVAASAVAGLVVATLVYVFHLGVTVAK